MDTLTGSEVRDAIRQHTARGKMADVEAIRIELCRKDAVGKTSKHDSEAFDKALAAMIASGEVAEKGPFVYDPKLRQ